jgi:hypothetical protein
LISTTLAKDFNLLLIELETNFNSGTKEDTKQNAVPCDLRTKRLSKQAIDLRKESKLRFNCKEEEKSNDHQSDWNNCEHIVNIEFDGNDNIGNNYTDSVDHMTTEPKSKVLSIRASLAQFAQSLHAKEINYKCLKESIADPRYK